MKGSGWQAHSVRGFLSGTVGKKLGLIASTKGEDGERTYSVGTRWAPQMDPWTLAYLARHRDMSITKRYIHPREQNTRAAIERARNALVGTVLGTLPMQDFRLI